MARRGRIAEAKGAFRSGRRGPLSQKIADKKGPERAILWMTADSDEAGHAFQYEAGHLFRSEAGRGSDLMSATARRRCGSWE
jgi:hypothetical protein